MNCMLLPCMLSDKLSGLQPNVQQQGWDSPPVRKGFSSTGLSGSPSISCEFEAASLVAVCFDPEPLPNVRCPVLP